MDEILASIRRIIADDDPMPRRPAARAPEPTRRPSAEPPRPAQPQAVPVAVAAGNAGPYSNGPHPHIQGSAAPRLPELRPSEQRSPEQHPADYPSAGELSFAVDAIAELVEAEVMADYPYQNADAGEPAQRRPEPVREHTAPRPAPARAPEPQRRPDPSSRPFADQSRRKDLLSPDVGAAVGAAFDSLGDAVLPAHERTVEDLVKEILRPMLKTWLDDNLPRVVERLVRQEIERVSRAPR